MNCVFEHVIHKVRVWLYEVVQVLQVLQLLPLLVVEDVEVDVAGVKLHVFELQYQIRLLFCNFFVPFLEFFLLLLKASDLLVYLFLHHRVEVLLLNFKRLVYPPKGLF